MDSVTSFFWDDGNGKSGNNGSFSGVVDSLWNGKDRSRQRSTDETHNGKSEPASASTGTSSLTQQLLTDKLVEKIIYMALPPSSDLAQDTIEHRVEAAKSRPGLSVPIMSRNFVQMNSRLSIPFMLVDELIKVFNWQNPSYTLSIMSLYTYMVLKPVPTFMAVPIFYLLFGIMVPNYLKIHKPEPVSTLEVNPVPAQGPPLVKPEVPKPVPEFSKEFVLNLTDLQNHMVLYVIFFDFVTNILTKFAFFTNENISTVWFLALLLLGCFNALFADVVFKWIPVKFILILCGWALAIILHPYYRERCLSMIYSEETRIRLLTLTNKCEHKVNEYFEYYEPRERRQAAIFELQQFNQHEKSWERVTYSTDDYTLFSDARISEKKIEEEGTQSLDDVKPPLEWEWVPQFKWTLDLNPKKWVDAGLVQYVDIDVGTKWVYDLNFDGSRGDYRRRRWIRVCVRKADEGIPSRNIDGAAQTKPNRLYQEKYNGYTGVTRSSMSGTKLGGEEKGSGNSNLEDEGNEGTQNDQVDDNCGNAEADEDNKNMSTTQSRLETSTSSLSISSALSNSSTQDSLKSNHSAVSSSKAVRSLTDLLNLTT